MIAELAGRQHGVVALRQLVARGLREHHAHHRVRAGQLRRVYRGVYAVGHAPMTRSGRWMAAVLACGEGALLSHRDAAALWELRPSNRRAIDVTAARSRSGHDGITLHRPRALHPDDLDEIDGIPVTSVARLLLDFAEVGSELQLARLVEQAELRRVFDLTAVDALLGRSNGRRGGPRLERTIAGARPFVPFTRSGLEEALLSACRAAGLPRPAMNLWAAGQEVDGLFAEQRVAVELDGAVVHGTRQARRRDPQRDAALQLAGYRVLRVPEAWLRDDPAGVARTLRALLEAAPDRAWAV